MIFVPNPDLERIRHTERTDYGCAGKVKHNSRHDAMKHLGRRKFENDGARPYQCPICGYWHVGRSVK